MNLLEILPELDDLETRIIRAMTSAFPDQSVPIAWRCQHSEAADMPYRVQFGSVFDPIHGAGDCIEFDWYDISHVVSRFEAFGVQMLRVRLTMGAKR